eukprot:TRINITY_DN15105_c0_g1_i1.p1 TRINITY_DN15105_c0_g1~~TRINITY_DN15105_c0_g1_i1.p1  ORF type:complete len:252 (+),score=64.37 TRINITY_DN15105_c0_g1_i1:33-788(+)
MAASAIGRRQMSGADAGCLLHPRGPQLLRNHAKENIRAMREKERKLRGQHIMLSQAPVPEPFKLKQFSNVKARLHGLKGQHGRNSPQDDGASPLEDGAAASPSRDGVARSPANAEVGVQEISLADFEAQVADMIRKHGSEKKQGFAKNADGRPKYLLKMQEERLEQQRKEDEQQKQPKVPQGYRLLPADEVKSALDALKKKHIELEAEYRRLPLKIENEGQKQRQKTVLSKIKESEKAIAMYSSPTVLVPA